MFYGVNGVSQKLRHKINEIIMLYHRPNKNEFPTRIVRIIDELN